MACSSKLCVALLAGLFLTCASLADVARAQHANAAQLVAELQFDLARSLADAGDHDAAAREFDRALQLQRAAASGTASTEQTQLALQTLRAYTQSRPELPRMKNLLRGLERAERAVEPAPAMMPNAPPGAPRATAPMMMPNAPPGAPSARRAMAGASTADVDPNPYHRSARPAASTTRSATTSSAHRAGAEHEATFQLRVPRNHRRMPRAWWEQVTLSADELLIPSEWTAALNNARATGPWPQVAVIWPELLVPEGWEQPVQGLATMLLIDTELLIPPGW